MVGDAVLWVWWNEIGHEFIIAAAGLWAHGVHYITLCLKFSIKMLEADDFHRFPSE